MTKETKDTNIVFEALEKSFRKGFAEGSACAAATLYRVFTEHLNYADNNIEIELLKAIISKYIPEMTVEQYLQEMRDIDIDFNSPIN